MTSSFDLTGADIADCENASEFAEEIPDAPLQYVKRCYRFLEKFLENAAAGSAATGWLCTVRSRFVAHDSQPACTRQTRLPGSYARLLYEAGLCLLCSRVHVSFILRIFAAVAAAPLSATVNKESSDASISASRPTAFEVAII